MAATPANARRLRVPQSARMNLLCTHFATKWSAWWAAIIPANQFQLFLNVLPEDKAWRFHAQLPI